jgi:predicted nucleotidyltransferase
MMSVRTLPQRRRNADRTRRRAADALVKDLESFAAEHPGVVLTVYGSLARGDMRRGSDADVLVDAPTPALEDAGMTAVEQAAARHGFEADVRPRRMCTDRFLEMIHARGAYRIGAMA